MTKLQLAQKTLELMSRHTAQMRTTGTPLGYDFHYGPLTLDILGCVYDKDMPSYIDVLYNGEPVGRLEKELPNKYHPRDDDNETLQAYELLRQICLKCCADKDAATTKLKAEREQNFLNA